MSKYADHARAMSETLSPEEVLKQINALNEQMEALQKSQPMFKADGEENQDAMDEAAPEMPADLSQEAPAAPMEGEQPAEQPAPEAGAEQAVEQAADAQDDSELQEIFGELSTEELQEVQSFIGKLLEQKMASEQPAPEAPMASPGQEQLEQSMDWMKKSQAALQTQIENLTKSISGLADKVNKPAPRPVSRPAVMNSESLAKSDRVPEMLKKSEVLEYLGTQVKKDPSLVGLYQDVTMAGEDSASLRNIYAKAERRGVKIPTKTF